MNWLNQNQGVVAVLLFTLGVIGFFIRKAFFTEVGKNTTHNQTQKSGNNSINIQSGRDTNL